MCRAGSGLEITMTKYQTGIFPVPSNVSVAETKVIKAMEDAGCTVILENAGMDGHVVKIREKGHRQIRAASTSWYPIKDAFAKWQERHGATV